MPPEMACPIDGRPDHPWRPFRTGEVVCATAGCFYTKERHEGVRP